MQIKIFNIPIGDSGANQQRRRRHGPAIRHGAAVMLMLCFSLSLWAETPRAALIRLLDDNAAQPLPGQIAGLESFLSGHPGLWEGYHLLCDRIIMSRGIPAARTYFQNALKSTNAGAGGAHWMLARLWQMEGRADSARFHYQQAISLLPDNYWLLDEFLRASRRGQLSAARAFLQQFPAWNDALPMKLLHDYYADSRPSERERLLARIQLPPDEYSSLRYLEGKIFRQLGHASKARKAWQQGEHQAGQAQRYWEQVRFYLQLGDLAERNNALAEALDYYNRALDTARRIGDYAGMQLALGYRAYMQRELARYTPAAASFREAIAIGESMSDHERLADWYKGYAFTRYQQGLYPAALSLIEQAESYTRDTADEANRGYIELDRATFYISLKQYALAEKALVNAGEFMTKAQNTSLNSRIRARQAEIMQLQGNQSEARRVFLTLTDEKSDPGYAVEGHRWLERIGRSYENEHHLDAAAKYYQDALSAAAPTLRGWYEMRLGFVTAQQGDTAGAEQHFSRADSIALQQGDRQLIWEAPFNEALALINRGAENSALIYLQQARQAFERVRGILPSDYLRRGYYHEGDQIYQQLAAIFYRRYQTDTTKANFDSLRYHLEAGRSQNFLALAQGGPDRGERNPAFVEAENRLRRSLRRLRRSIVDLRPAAETARLERDLPELKANLLETLLAPATEETVFTLPPPQLPHTDSLLAYLEGRQAAMVIYHITADSPDSSYALLLQQGSRRMVKLKVNPDTLAGNVADLLAPFHKISPAFPIDSVTFDPQLAHRLYQQLITPLEAEVRLLPHLIIVPDQSLVHLPFEMLLRHPVASGSYRPDEAPEAAPDFLAQHYAVSYAPTSALALPEQTAARPWRPEMMIYANLYDSLDIKSTVNRLLTRSGLSFYALQHAEAEAREIAQRIPGTQRRARREATREALRGDLARYDIVHLATHAFIDSSYDAYAGIVVTAGPDSSDDGLLLDYEIMGLEINCDLVTLSACETGRGRLSTGEGVLGLARAFLGAGAGNVLATHWKIDDWFTSQIMPDFYEAWLDGGLSKAAALAAVRQKLLAGSSSQQRRYRHPAYWAAYTLYGLDTPPRPLAPRYSHGLMRLLPVLLLLGISLWLWRRRKK